MEFKKSGKFIYSYSDLYTQNAYYMATAADKILLNPSGDLSFRGYAFQLMFYKNLIDKMDIDVQIFRHGQFKSAVEPYFLDKMSEANREQLSTLANSLWTVLVQDVAKSRKLSVDQLNNIADNLLCSSPQEALSLKLVDKLAYPDEAEKMIKTKLNLGEKDKVNYVSVNQYAKTISNKEINTDKVAVMYAYGSISDGKGDSERGIYSETFVKEFRKVYKNDNVKAIVLRVNSPGGSALASENIWREIELAKKAGKKVVVSMGDYAASGGYYISCNADYIFAEPNTITGSIGVFGMVPSLQKFMKQITKTGSQMECVEDVMEYRDDEGLEESTEAKDAELRKLSGKIEMKNVSFGYSRLEEPLIRNLSLTLEPGSSIALVGASGCGKSTISKLISGLYQPWEGEILFDGKPRKAYPREVMVGSLAVVDQDIILFEDTVANNIKMWDNTIMEFEMILAARDAGVHDDIMQLSGGYQHRLSSGGRELSGGQRQRLEIARVLAQDPTIIILDEATSALDAVTEYEVVKAIRERGITCIVIAHRLSTVRDCDQIIVLDHGVETERGTHNELMKNGGAYAELVSSE